MPAPIAASAVPATPPPPRPAAGLAPSSATVCSRCRGIADPGADFCKFCGARLAPTPPDPPPPAQPAPAVQRAAEAPRGASASPAQGTPAAQQAPVVDPSSPHGATRPLHSLSDSTPRGRLVRIAKDGSEGGQHPLFGDQTDIGRSEGNIILPDDPYLSPRHARIVARPAPPGSANPVQLRILDLGSVNGVFVRLRAPHPVAHGDLILLGQQVLRFETVSEIEGARGPAMQHGVLLFGSPAPVAHARLAQRTVEGLTRDVFYLVRDEFVLGREVGDRTFSDDVFMSRRHAAVRRDPTRDGGNAYVVHDLGSSNGTFVQIHAEHPLEDGDQFRIGHHLFRVDLPAPGASS
jgi:pSer/pThr/pTyr-binding forkhead associated (FHA) protein